MPKPLHRQLLEATEARRLTWDELIRLADLDCSPDSISRKLRGKQSLRSTEVEKIATALHVVVVAGRTREAA